MVRDLQTFWQASWSQFAMEKHNLIRSILAVFIGVLPAVAEAQQSMVSLHTNFFYFGPVKEEFAAYVGEDGKLIRHGRFRDWNEDGFLWHEIEYKDGKPHGNMI